MLIFWKKQLISIIGSVKIFNTLPFVWCFQGGRGKFLYAHSAAQREGDVAKVTTRRPFPASIGRCHLSFWFYMHGSDRMGTLKVT